MSRRWRVRALAALVLHGVLVAGLFGPPAEATRAARAAPAAPAAVAPGVSAAPVTVALLSVSPSAPRPDDTLTVTARATNTTAQPIGSFRLRLRIGSRPIPDRASLASYAAGTSPQLDGPMLGDRLVTSTVLAATSAGTAGTATPAPVPAAPLPAPLPARGSTEVTLQLPMSDLGLITAGAYPLAVDARGQTRAGSASVGILRTFLPFVPKVKQFEPTKLAWLLPLTDVPRRDASGRFLDDGLVASLTRGGRLARLVALGAEAEVTWAVDPSLLEDVLVMSRGYPVRHDGRSTPGAGTAGALEWLSALRAAVPRFDVAALPYANPDAVALHRAGMDADLTSATTRAAAVATEVLGTTVRGSLGWTPNAHIDSGTAETLRLAGVRALVVDGRDLVPVGPPLPYTPTGRGSVPGLGGELTALIADPVLSGLATLDTRVVGAAAVGVQRFLAETLTVTGERPGDGRTLLVAPPATWNPQPAFARALLELTRTVPWLRPASVEELRTSDRGVTRSRLSYPRAAREAERPPGVLAAIGSSRESLLRLGDVLTLPELVTGRYDAALLRTASAAFRGEGEGLGLRLLRAVDDDLGTWTSGVRVVAGTATLPDASASFPLTLVNDLDQPVKVRLVLDSSTPRLRLTTPGIVTIPASRKIQVPIRAEAALTGEVSVTATLLTPGGRVFGQPTSFKVRLTKLGRVALVLVIGAGTFLFGAVLVRAGRRIRGLRPAPNHGSVA